MSDFYDIITVGGGPAGLSAAIYAARSGASVAVVESLTVGGVAAATPEIENYPGYERISGYELSQKMSEQAQRLGARIIYGKVEKIRDGQVKRLQLSGGEELTCSALVLAPGSTPRKLGVERESELLGAGLSYCATCDGNFFRGKHVVVAGAGKHAASAEEYLRNIAQKVTVVNPRVTPVTKLIGNPLAAIEISENGTARVIECGGLFVELGYEPSTELVKGFVQTDQAGYVICNERMQTDKAGVFAAGDIVRKPLRQIVTAAADGAIAGQFAAAYAKIERV